MERVACSWLTQRAQNSDVFLRHLLIVQPEKLPDQFLMHSELSLLGIFMLKTKMHNIGKSHSTEFCCPRAQGTRTADPEHTGLMGRVRMPLPC